MAVHATAKLSICDASEGGAGGNERNFAKVSSRQWYQDHSGSFFQWLKEILLSFFYEYDLRRGLGQMRKLFVFHCCRRLLLAVL